MSSESGIRVLIAGAAGKMGREAVTALCADSRFSVVGGVVRNPNGQAAETLSIPLFGSAEEALESTDPDVWLDLTDASSVVKNVDRALAYGAKPVVGATGYTQSDLARWNEVCLEKGIGGLAAPNFAIGALLMMHFAAQAARFFEHAEIIELHHDGKKDAPSGTAKRTAETIAIQRADAVTTAPVSPLSGQASAQVGKSSETNAARGLVYQDVAIHSVRLPGLVAHQEVLFGGNGEVLTIRHDSMSRQSFMPGVKIACEKVLTLTGMVYGLENLLW